MNGPMLHKTLLLPKRMKSYMFGKMHFKSKFQNKICIDYNNKKKKTKNEKFSVKKQKSSFVFLNFYKIIICLMKE